MPPAKRKFRFAPSPNGLLHLGHAYSALCNDEMARACGGVMLLRLEDIDTARCTPQFERQIFADLGWLGIAWPDPVRRQSDHFADYGEALERLRRMGLVYPAFLTRRQIGDAVSDAESRGRSWPRDPDGAPHYPGSERDLSEAARQQAIHSGRAFAWRLDMRRACDLAGNDLTWQESGHGPRGESGLIAAEPSLWGDVILARKDTPTSYHLSVCVDDALQGITDVVRGHDLYHATSVHRLLQRLLELPQPQYHHHRLLVDAAGKKLSKSDGDTAIAALRERGLGADAVIQMCKTGATI